MIKTTITNLDNPLLDVDSYKASHYLQYPPGTEYVYSYIESRQGGKFNETLFFGLQAFIKKYLLGQIQNYQIDEAEEFWKGHGLPFSREIWRYIVMHHAGHWPVEIRAVPEGVVLNSGVPLVTVVNTDPKCPWVTSFLETALLRAVWYPTTVATNSFECKRLLKAAFDKTSDNPDEIIFKLHDFGGRGVSSKESAEIGGMAHLINFKGSDTVSGILASKHFYNCDMAAFSLPASEHSTITAWGTDHEIDAYENMINQFGKSAIFACVSDSYDLDNAVENIWGGTLRECVLNMQATLVVRPDSGSPEIVPIDVIEKLYEKFGGTVNSKGYRVLHPKVRVIQGDGINYDSLKRILFNLEMRGYSIDNLAFGMGGGLLQQIDRDTLRFAMKASAICINGEWRDVYKAPKTDMTKASKRGRFCVIPIAPGQASVVPLGAGNDWENLLEPVYKNGKLLRDENFDVIRDRANAVLA